MHRTPPDPKRAEKGAERPNTIGLEAPKLDLLLNHLDAPEVEQPAKAKRHFARWPFRRIALNITIIHPGGSQVSLKLACRNLSCGGVGVLHTSFLHAGSKCIVELPSETGSVDRIEGVVSRCMHRRGTLHEIGIRFTRGIDLSRYVRRDADYVPALEKVDATKLVGSILCIDPSDADVELVRAVLGETQLSLRQVRTATEAIAEDTRSFSLIICERQLPDMHGLNLVQKLRAANVITPVFMVSRQGWGPGEVTDRLSAWARKPVEPGLMLRIIAELHHLKESRQVRRVA